VNGCHEHLEATKQHVEKKQSRTVEEILVRFCLCH